MCKWLASVQSLTEVQALASCLPDIVDMKQPSQGALGALPVETVKHIVNWLDQRCLSSATIGDLPMQADKVAPALIEMAGTGVDFVKIGLFADGNVEACLTGLSTTVQQLSKPVIAVMFADQAANLQWIELVKQAGFKGIMVDTARKDGRGLLDHWSTKQLEMFIAQARKHDLLCGLAGALKIEDITLLKDLGADYLGFRSALCHQRQRTSQLKPELAQQIQLSLEAPLEQAV